MTELSTLQPQQPSAAPEAWIERVFLRMSGMYGAKFAEAWKGVDIAVVKTTWAEALAGFTGDEIKRGLDSCLTREWPPTLPEFVKLCRPYLDHQVAYEIAAKQLPLRDGGSDKWPEAAIYWAAATMSYDLKMGSYEKLKTRWRSALDDAREAVRAGKLPDTVPTPPPMLERVKVEMTEEQKEENLKKLRSIIDLLRD